MLQTVKVAAAQMDANPAPVSERLERARRIVIHAAQAGARLVVLPELFNTGYDYTDANYRLVEQPDGLTSLWMKETAAQLDVYLAGSLLLREGNEIVNALLLFSPTGQVWRYDKNYPWAWERGYFREGKGTTIAHTGLGDLGMLICWDIGHPQSWRRYAGQVNLMITCSCPPDVVNATCHFPDGHAISFKDANPLATSMKEAGQRVFGDMLYEQTAWLGVPAVNSGACGQIRTGIPRGELLLKSMILMRPSLIKQISQARHMQMSCSMLASCKVVSAEGQELAQRSPAEGEGYAITDVNLPDARPIPGKRQPKAPINRTTYWVSDVLIPFLMRSIYRKGLQQIAEKKSNPISPAPKDG